ncbi:MAG: hypothetical protein FJZ98_01000 [Chloroflexi bacterium]|nr:hypothetical protein [Chloroflexota bacterium]
MDSETISEINRKVFKQFPYLKDTMPDVSKQGENRWLLLYKRSAVTADGHEMPVVVRVITDDMGTMIKITTSR